MEDRIKEVVDMLIKEGYRIVKPSDKYVKCDVIAGKVFPTWEIAVRTAEEIIFFSIDGPGEYRKIMERGWVELNKETQGRRRE